MDKTQMIISIVFGALSLINVGVATYCSIIIIQKHIDKCRLDKKYGKEEIFHG